VGKDRLRRLASQIREKEETDRSMRLASLRQRRMLPNTPTHPKYDFAVVYEPAMSVSGDFYDFIPVSENVCGIVVGDVTGHGVEAGIIMGMAKQTVSIYARQIEGPAEVLREANAELHRALDGKTFVSLSYSVLDMETRSLRFVRAGQNKPYLLNPNWQNPVPQVIDSKGLALGVDKGPRFAKVTEEIDMKLEPGDIFFQYTDGLIEATNKEKEQYGEARLRELLQRYSRTSAGELLEIVIESMQDFTRAREQDDDITMVAVRVKDPAALSRTAHFDRATIERLRKTPIPGGPTPPQAVPAEGKSKEEKKQPPPTPGLPDWLK
jgi:sigma-B regulation protein RsbU (phosphoserine phosphatase)